MLDRFILVDPDSLHSFVALSESQRSFRMLCTFSLVAFVGGHGVALSTCGGRNHGFLNQCNCTSQRSRQAVLHGSPRPQRSPTYSFEAASTSKLNFYIVFNTCNLRWISGMAPAHTWSARTLWNTFLLAPILCGFATFLITLASVSVWANVTGALSVQLQERFNSHAIIVLRLLRAGAPMRVSTKNRNPHWWHLLELNWKCRSRSPSTRLSTDAYLPWSLSKCLSQCRSWVFHNVVTPIATSFVVVLRWLHCIFSLASDLCASRATTRRQLLTMSDLREQTVNFSIGLVHVLHSIAADFKSKFCVFLAYCSHSRRASEWGAINFSNWRAGPLRPWLIMACELTAAAFPVRDWPPPFAALAALLCRTESPTSRLKRLYDLRGSRAITDLTQRHFSFERLLARQSPLLLQLFPLQSQENKKDSPPTKSQK